MIMNKERNRGKYPVCKNCPKQANNNECNLSHLIDCKGEMEMMNSK